MACALMIVDYRISHRLPPAPQIVVRVNEASI